VKRKRGRERMRWKSDWNEEKVKNDFLISFIIMDREVVYWRKKRQVACKIRM